MTDTIKLSDHFSYRRLLRFVYPSIIMVVFSSIYGVVDGIFVTNFVGKTPFAAINLVMPVFIILGAIGFMLGTGGAAIVGKLLGEGKPGQANEMFSLIVYTNLIMGGILSCIGFVFLKTLAGFLGAEGEMMKYCLMYGRILLLSLPFFMIQQTFQELCITAEKPKIGLAVIVIAGVLNMALDAIFIVVFQWGVVGAAVATAMSEFCGGVLPLIYFGRKNSSLLKLGKTKFYGRELLKACVNGSSEFISSISGSIVVMLFNWQLLKFAGEDGVAAYGAITYICYLFIAIFEGYVIGVAPIISFNFGAQNKLELKNIFTKSVRLVFGAGIVMCGICEIFALPLSAIFTGYDHELFDMTVTGLRLFAISFVLTGYNFFCSALFTALNNGLISAVVSFSRAIIFECGFVTVLPIFLGLNGIWLAMICTETVALVLGTVFVILKRKKYGYI